MTQTFFLSYNTGLFEQVLGELDTHDRTFAGEEESGVFSKPRRVLVQLCLSVTKGLEQRTDLKDLLLQVCSIRPSTAQLDDMSYHKLGRLCLPGATLTADDDTLVLFVGQHVVVARIRDGKDVRWEFLACLSIVLALVLHTTISTAKQSKTKQSKGNL